MADELMTDQAAWRRGGRPAGWWTQLYELGAFLFLIVPSMVLSFFAIHQGRINFVLVASSIIARDLALVCLIRFFLWRNREPVERVGWTFKGRGQDMLFAGLLFLPLFFGMGALGRLLRAAGFTAPATPLPSFLTARGVEEFVLAGVLVLVVAVTEETIFRGYLILRLRNLTASPVVAVVLSSVIFSLGHGYEGTAGVVVVGVLGLVFALVYLWRGSLVAPITLHFLQDFIGIVLLPLVLHGR